MLTFELETARTRPRPASCSPKPRFRVRNECFAPGNSLSSSKKSAVNPGTPDFRIKKNNKPPETRFSAKH